jgi:transposase
MRDRDLFQLALGLSEPWLVQQCKFDVQRGILDIYLDFPRGSKFLCPECGAGGCAVHDTEDAQWRHLNFFEHRAYLHARRPRVRCEHCGVHTVHVPWARPGSGFTLLFEAFVMTLAKEMPVMAIAALVGEWDTVLWRIIHHWVGQARSQQDFSEVTKVGIDETAARRGHNYISVFVDLDSSTAMFVTEGKDASTVERFVEDFQEHGGKTEKVKDVCCDMSPAFIRGVKEAVPEAEMTFDKFHVTRIVNDAVDQVRRSEQKQRPELKGSRYSWIKNEENLSDKQATMLDELNVASLNLKTARAWRMRVAFQQLYLQRAEQAEDYVRQWLGWAARSRLQPMIKAARTIRKHLAGVLRWFHSHINNGVLEGLNSLIQAAKARARGYRTMNNLITAVYLVAGKLDFDRVYPQ